MYLLEGDNPSLVVSSLEVLVNEDVLLDGLVALLSVTSLKEHYIVKNDIFVVLYLMTL